MSEPDQRLREEVEKELDQEFEWQELEEGLNTIYRLLPNEGESYILKVQSQSEDENLPYFKKDREGRFLAEPIIYRIVNENTSVPSPGIIYISEGGDYPKAFYVMEDLEGENAKAVRDQLELEELGEVIRQYGEVLGEIHRETELDDYGLLTAEGGEIVTMENAGNWKETFREILLKTEEVIDATWEDKPELGVEKAINRIDILPERPHSSLLHMDNRLENLLLEGSEVTALMDWNFTRAGHEELDLARAEYLLIDYELDLETSLGDSQRDMMRERLLEGYTGSNNIEKGEGFSERRQLYRYSTVLWLLAGFPNWSSSWDQEARKEMEEELLGRLEEEKIFET